MPDIIISLFSQGIRYHQNHADLHLYRGQAFYRSGENDNAILDFQTAIDKRTKKSYAFSHLGLALFRNGQSELCDKWFTQARLRGRRTEHNYRVRYDISIKSFLTTKKITLVKLVYHYF